MTKRYIRISSDICEWGWYSDVNTFRVFFHLLATANWKDSEFRGHPVLRGQVVISRKKITSALNLSEQSVRTAFQHLQDSSEIVTQTTNKYTIVTICRYDYWTCSEAEEQPATNQQLTSNQPENQPTTNQQINQQTNQQRIDVNQHITPLKTELYAGVESNHHIQTNQQINQQINQQSTNNQPATSPKNNHNSNNIIYNNITSNNKKEGLINKPKKKVFDVREDLSYVDMFPDLWGEWLDYKDEINKQYKTLRGAKSAFTQLKKMSGQNYEKAKEILEQSYRGSWEGFFPLKVYNGEEKKCLPIQQKGRDAEIRTEEDERKRRAEEEMRKINQYWAYGVPFDTLEEWDVFYKEQIKIREGVEKGDVKLFDDWAEESYELMEALVCKDGIAYKYGHI